MMNIKNNQIITLS